MDLFPRGSPLVISTLAALFAFGAGKSAPAVPAFDLPGSSALDGIRREYERNRRAAFAVPGGYRARNIGQQWATQFDGRGFLVTPGSGLWSWGLELKSYGWSRQLRTVEGPARLIVDKERVSYAWDRNLREWWINDQRGLEHGFTLQARPEATRTKLSLRLKVRGDLLPRVLDAGHTVSFLDRGGRDVLTYAGLRVSDSEGRELAARMETIEGCAKYCLQLEVDDGDARYPLTIDPTAQQAYLKPSNTGTGGWFGYSVSISGDTAVVGEPLESSKATGVNGDQSDHSASRAGAAYVFVRNAGVWTQQAYLKASNSGAGDYFGQSIAISGDTVVVGAPYENGAGKGVDGNQARGGATLAGAAYVFVRNAGVWTQQAYLKASNAVGGIEFGNAVAVSGDTVVVGAHNEGSGASGVNGDPTQSSSFFGPAAYVFVRTSGKWTQQAYLKASNTVASSQGGANANFGWSVAVSGDTAVVGAYRESSSAKGVNGNQSDHSAFGAGAAYVFVRTGVQWSQQAYLKASNTAGTTQQKPGDAFGSSVAISDDTIVAGAYLESGNTSGVNGNPNSRDTFNEAGAAYVFVRTGAQWSQQAYLKASNTAGEGNADVFGLSVAVSGDTVVVGAPHENCAATANGYQYCTFSVGAGAAYVFIRNAGVWKQATYLKGSNTGPSDNFGWSVAVSGGTTLVGAQQESSSATGVNGNQNDDSVYQSGAAYTFVLAPPPVISSVGNASGDSPILSGNTWVTIKGTNLSATTRTWQDSDFVNGKMPTALDGVSVSLSYNIGSFINIVPAYVYYVSPTQINVLTTLVIPVGAVQLRVTSGRDSSELFTVQAQQVSPSFFLDNGGPYVAALHADGSLIGPPSLYPGFTTPAKPGETIVVYGNGFGVTLPLMLADNEGSAHQSGTLSIPPVIKIGGIEAKLQFAGLISPGLFQFNMVVPVSTADGDISIAATEFNGTNAEPTRVASTPAGTLLTVKR